MLSITKSQNLKAIHDMIEELLHNHNVVINHKTTKFESNSQQESGIDAEVACCYQLQNYKIWKQFTTIRTYHYKREKLLSITKLQNLKAIHNQTYSLCVGVRVVINHKTTKFESNSQRRTATASSIARCYQSQSHKIWKQFTTIRSQVCS